MSTKEEVLKKLIDSNDYVSGEMLAKEIGVSRASVWKAIKTLQKAGYDIEGESFSVSLHGSPRHCES